MPTCECKQPHERRRIVLTGGPGAGKTAVLGLIAQAFCEHVRILPEAAGIVFGGGFPRDDRATVLRAAQRAIYCVQRELEASTEGSNAAIVLCDRGTVDGVAYWPGPEDLWSSVGTTLDAELSRYDAVIHLRTPSVGYNQDNPLRIESAAQALKVDERIAAAWAAHPRRFVVDAAPDFLEKARVALKVLREQLPACCRRHVVPSLDLPAQLGGAQREGAV